MTTRSLASALLLGGLCLPASATLAQQKGEAVQQKPKDLGITEQAEGRLAQVDVTVRGPARAIADLSPDDFELIVDSRFIEEFEVDRICRDISTAESETLATTTDEPTAIGTTLVPTRVAPATFLFYFDQTFLTMQGRIRSMEMAREMIPQLIRSGNRGIVVSSGQVLTTFADLTDDIDALLQAVEAIEKDRRQWDPTIGSEESRIQEVIDTLNDPSFGGTQKALSVARRHQAEERWRAAKALRRFSMVLGRLADLGPPKAVVYFADRVRSRPGEHYLNLFSAVQREDNSTASAMELDAFSAMNVYDRVVDEANAFGVRLYTIQAEGLTTLADINMGPRSAGSFTSHVRDAQNSLVGLAQETGGEAFLNGVKAAKILRHIQEDLACVYLLSFAPADFREDVGLPVRVRIKKDKVRAQVRGQLVIQSESARQTSRLMAGFAAPSAVKNDLDVRGLVIPTGYADGKYSALVQVAVPGSTIARAKWDLGASLVSRGKVHEDEAGRIEVATPGAAVVLETEMEFDPGPYELVLVAHETNSDQIATGQVEGDWPDPSAAPVTVGPIALMQPARAAFLRGGNVRTQGALARADVESVQTELPTALISLICRGKRQKGPFVVQRRLVGDSAADFGDTVLEFGEERCAQIRDVIPAGTMTDGSFEYEIHVRRPEEEEEVTSGSRGFSAVSTTPRQAESGEAGPAD